MVTRRQFGGTVFGAVAALALPLPLQAAAKRYAPVELGKGRYSQSWFLESFLELADDHGEAKGSGKRFAIVWEQEGCPYCREMHMVNFAIPEIRDYVERNFEIIQLDIWGSREVTDFAGNTMTERELAKAWKIRFTPTIQFITDDGAALGGNKPKSFEVARMPGYLRPIHFLWLFEFVREQAYQKSNFRTYVVEKVAAYQAAGKKFPDW
ncbi:MAG: thioredoxin fold domain-containing protein [Rhodospirillaceae bacterium]|jgi:thioredoxin-related protein|nr:thioredoxin fold domain-containing protein [Rhodospirillaceae bacterium]MBT5194885.1 thioredoxin fold domain-containing protein [Rhodospirillaceae bacterium]